MQPKITDGLESCLTMCGNALSSLMKTTKRKSEKKRRNPTWTFQPDDDVRKIVVEILGENPKRGELTKLMNIAVKLKAGAAAQVLLQSQIDKLKAQQEALKNKA